MKVILSLAFILISFFTVLAQAEQSPIQEKEIKYKDWTYKTVADGKDLNLRQLIAGKKLVLIAYFSPWCPDWKHEIPFALKIYDKYKSNGLEIIGIGEYGTVDAMKTHVEFYKLKFPVVYESDSKAAKEKTKHFAYRKDAGDKRGWGTPWNIFLIPENLESDGETLTKKAFISNGVLVESEAENFIREKLGLPAENIKAETSKNKSIEVCDPDKRILELKKP